MTCDITPVAPRSRDRARTADLGRGHGSQQEIAVLVEVAAHAALQLEPRQIGLRHLAESVLLPGVDRDHEMARETFDQPAGAEIVEALLFERRRKRSRAWLPLAHRAGADHGAEDEPGWHFILARARRPGEAPAADQRAVDADRVRPVEGDRLFGRRVHRQRIGERGHSGIEGAPGGREPFFRLEHDRELGEIEPPDIDQRAGALRRRDPCRVPEGVAHLSQGHQAERRGQIERGRKWRPQTAPGLERHLRSRTRVSCCEYL